MIKRLLLSTALAVALSAPALVAHAQTSPSTPAPAGQSTQPESSGAAGTSTAPSAGGTTAPSAGGTSTAAPADSSGASKDSTGAATTPPAPATGGTASTTATPPPAPATSGTASTTATTGGAAGPVTQQQADDLLADDVIGMSVRNPQNESIGKIADLVMDKSGQVKAAVLSVGGFLGLGSKKVAVPWKDVQFNVTDKDHTASVNMNKEQLTQAPEFKTTDDQRKDADRAATRERSTSPSGAGGAGAPARGTGTGGTGSPSR